MFKKSKITLLYLLVFVTFSFITLSYQLDTDNPISSIDYGPEVPLRMNMSSSIELTLNVSFNDHFIRTSVKEFDSVELDFIAKTVSPQFNILSIDPQSRKFLASRKMIENSKYNVKVPIKLNANYIGHATLQPDSVRFIGKEDKSYYALPKILPVTIVQYEGVWGHIFLISVAIFMLISYVNLGAQLDEENMLKLIKKPKTLILGFLIGVIVMPLIAWFVGLVFLEKQPLFRAGSFIFACGPAASASTLWTVMLNSDKELSVGLQVVSTIGALITMPILLYIMDQSLHLNQTQVPFGRLIQTLLALLIALIVGWRLVGRNQRAQKISRQIFRPLVFFVLIFIIVFSSILYWHIYQMFDWTIALVSFINTMSTFLISGLLGHFIDCNLDQAIAISIGSAYKNSGIAFAVLLVAFNSPDTYIAYVPCLTQIVMTSLSLYLTYLIVSLYNYFKRRGQPNVIQATSENEDTAAKEVNHRRETKSGSMGDKSTKSDENDELIAMNVTDVEQGSLPGNTQPKLSAGSRSSVDGQDSTTVTVDNRNAGGPACA